MMATSSTSSTSTPFLIPYQTIQHLVLILREYVVVLISLQPRSSTRIEGGDCGGCGALRNILLLLVLFHLAIDYSLAAATNILATAMPNTNSTAVSISWLLQQLL